MSKKSRRTQRIIEETIDSLLDSGLLRLDTTWRKCSLVEQVSDVGARGSTAHVDQTDWERLRNMTDEEAQANAESDPDAQPPTDEELEKAGPPDRNLTGRWKMAGVLLGLGATDEEIERLHEPGDLDYIGELADAIRGRIDSEGVVAIRGRIKGTHAEWRSATIT